jgi:protoporphyrinogen oxidase
MSASIAILGAGPAGLGAAYRFARRGGFPVTVLERQQSVGGNAGSFDLAGLRVDYGSHRLHPACAPEILADIQSLLKEDLLDRPRHGRMRIRGRWVHFPLKPLDLAANLPPSFTFGVLRDTLGKLAGGKREETFEGLLRRGLGRTICEDFYFPLAKKIWGADPSELDAEQARRRVAAGSIGKMVRKVLHAVPGFQPKGAGRFYYPRRGFGQISDAYYCAALKAGARIHLNTPVTAIELDARGRAAAVRFEQGGQQQRIAAKLVLSTIPISALARMVTGETGQRAAPEHVIEAARSLKFRAMILVYLVLETERFTEFDAHYLPDPAVAITRLSEPKNYGLAALPGKTVLCAELPCAVTDAVWKASDEELGELVRDALGKAGLPVRAKVLEVTARRLPQAYPIYTRDYRRHFDAISNWIDGIDGLVTFGRQGLFAHDNTHHTLAMAYALDNCIGADGQLDRQKWQACLQEFTKHVVED